MNRKKRMEIELLADEIMAALEKASEYINANQNQKAVADKIAAAVKKYLDRVGIGSGAIYSDDWGSELCDEIEEALELGAKKNETYPQREPGVDY